MQLNLLGLIGFLVFVTGLQVASHPLTKDENSEIPENDRIDCFPKRELNKEECENFGCEFESVKEPAAPSCFLPPHRHWYSYQGPEARSIDARKIWSVMEENKLTIPLATRSNYSFTGKPPVKTLTLEFERYSTRVMGFRIRDSDHKRYEVPSSVVKLAIPRRLNKQFYRVEYVSDANAPFAFKIIRASTNTTLIDTTLGGMVFEENFIQFVTKLASSYVYGLGDNRHSSFRHKMDWATAPIFSRQADPTVRDQSRNYAGVHPFYMVVENEGNAHGVFLLNSNALEYKFQPSPALTLRAMGGVLEFVVCFGVTPNDVIIEYTQVIGRPEIPPYWSLGFHETSRVEDVDDVINKFHSANLPLDVLHVSSRDSEREWDVTVLKESLLKSVKRIQAAGGHAMVSVPPHIRVDSEDEALRSAYQDGLWKDIFVKWPASYTNRSDILPESFGPSSTLFGTDKSHLQVAYVDFFQPAAADWWENWLNSLHQEIPWDGFILERNQPYSPYTNLLKSGQNGLQCPKNNSLESPGYIPSAISIWNSSYSSNFLSDNSICMVAEHIIDNKTYSHFDVHNIYGHSQAVATKKAVWKITGKRGFVISDSNFASTGTVAGIWLRTSLKESLSKAIRQSIISALEFNFFGITVAGGSVELLPSDESACVKWQIFTTFHVLAKSVLNNCLKNDTIFDSTIVDSVKKALDSRFRLLPFLYTLFFHGWMEGEAVFRPVFFEFGTKFHDRNVFEIDDQFFWGSAIMFAPSFDNNATRNVYFPQDSFYSLNSGQKILGEAKRISLSIPENEMGIFLRAGYIIPTQPPQGASNIRSARSKDFSLLIAAHQHSDGSSAANGNLFWDDGESLDTIEKKDYMSWFIYNRWQEGNYTRALLDYDVERNSIENIMSKLKFSSFVIYGYSNCPDHSAIELRLNGRILSRETDGYSTAFDAQHEVLTINLAVPLSHSFNLQIMYEDKTLVQPAGKSVSDSANPAIVLTMGAFAFYQL